MSEITMAEKCTWNKETMFSEWCQEKPTFALCKSEAEGGKAFALLCTDHKDQCVAALDKARLPYQVTALDESNTIHLILPETGGDKALHLLPCRGNFQAGDTVTDLTAMENGWPDREGIVEEVDGSHVKVKYSPSGTVRWKMHINLQKK